MQESAYRDTPRAETLQQLTNIQLTARETAQGDNVTNIAYVVLQTETHSLLH